MANPSTNTTMKLQKLLQRAYSNGTYETVTKAIQKRILVKKDLVAGKAVDKIAGFNALNSTLEGEVEAAVAAENQRRARAKAREMAKAKAEAKTPSVNKVPRNAFSAGGAALELTKRKNTPL